MDLQLHNELEIPPFFSWVNPLFRLGHVQVRKLLVDQRETTKNRYIIPSEQHHYNYPIRKSGISGKRLHNYGKSPFSIGNPL